MTKYFWFFTALVLVGLIVLAWPEGQAEPVVRFSDEHGPSILDSAGLLIMMAGYLPMVVQVILKFKILLQKLGHIKLIVLTVLPILCCVTIAISLFASSEWLLWTSVGVSITCQLVLILPVFNK